MRIYAHTVSRAPQAFRIFKEMKILLQYGITFLLLLANFTAGADASNPPLITIIKRGEPLPADAQKLRTIVMTGNDPARGCAQFELEQNAFDSATAMGANVIREDAIRERSQEFPCNEITFTFYLANDAQAVEQRFSWTPGRPLMWTDFKGSIPQNAANSTAAETSCGIGIETNTVTSQNDPKVYVYNTFHTSSSWVRTGYNTVDILEHEQGHWNICELYTRKMRIRFATAGIDLRNLKAVVGKIYSETQREYSARQEQYERETQHGIIREQQMHWTEMINNELVETPM